MKYELTGLSILLTVCVLAWVLPLTWLGTDDPRAMFVIPFGLIGTVFVPFVMRDIIKAQRSGEE